MGFKKYWKDEINRYKFHTGFSGSLFFVAVALVFDFFGHFKENEIYFIAFLLIWYLFRGEGLTDLKHKNHRGGIVMGVLPLNNIPEISPTGQVTGEAVEIRRGFFTQFLLL